MDKTQRKNLLKLAVYLESLPRDYKHFDMRDYADHRGKCSLRGEPRQLAAAQPREFLSNCGTVACAAGHGPAAGIRPHPTDFVGAWFGWSSYVARSFTGYDDDLFDFLFTSGWEDSDNTHYGAAARIRYFLATGNIPRAYPALAREEAMRKYAPYKKGSRSKIRRAIDAEMVAA